MKITLNNFRCYASKDISTPSSGVILVSGPSGKGKSTLLNAISYAITGEGKNVSTFGTTKTSVSIDIDGIKITRTKRPNRLTLQYPDGTLVEDDEAQASINKMFGSFFNHSSYIMQGNLNTFLYMSPTEKLEFFEEFVFNTLDLSEKKDKIKALIKERNTNLVSYRSKLEMVESSLKGKSEPQKPVFPIKCQKEERADIKAKYQRLQTNKKNALSDLESRLRRSLEIQKSNESKKGEIVKLTARLEEYQRTLESTETKIKSMDYKHVDNTELIQNIQREIGELQKARDACLSCGSIEDVSALESKLAGMVLWPEETEDETLNAIDANTSMLKDLERYYGAKTRLESLGNPQDLDSIRKEIQTAELCKKTLVCPCCKESLTFDGNSLYRMMKMPSASISELRNKLAKAEKVEETRTLCNSTIKEIESEYDEIYTLDDVRDSLEEYTSYRDKNKRLEMEYKSLERRISEIKESNSRVVKKKRDSIAVMSKYGVDETTVSTRIDTLRDDVNRARSEMEESRRTKVAIDEMKDLIESTRKSILNMEEKINNTRIEETESPTEINECISKERKDLEKIESVLEKIDLFERNTKESMEYEKLKKEKVQCEMEVKKWDELLQSIYILKEKISIAESLYLEKTLHDLNAKIQDNLNLFFVDEPMMVSLETFKPSKDKKESKPQINLQVFYKGVDMDLMSLSGGERDRVNLAIILALNSIFDSPMLMLDECISSLDYNNFNRVIDSLQENLKDKLVLLVCHQAEEGQFDDVLAI